MFGLQGLRSVVAVLVFVALPAVAGAAEPSTASISTDVASVAPNGGQVVLTVTAPPADSCTLRVSPSLPGWPITVKPCGGVIRETAALPADTDTADRTFSFSAMVKTGTTKVPTGIAPVRQTHQIRVAIFGDSLMWETIVEMENILGRTTAAPVTWNAYPGTDLCQYADNIKKVAVKKQPDLVILEFLGPWFSACSQVHTRLSPAWYDDYQSMTVQVIDSILKGNPNAKVELVDAPTYTNHYYGRAISGSSKFARIYQAVAALHPTHVTYVNAGISVEGANGSWVRSLPCLAVEKTQGLCSGADVQTIRISGIATKVIAVRGPDKLHFCTQQWPLSFPLTGCPNYSSGVYRYSAAMLIPGMQAFGLGPLPDLSF